MSSSWKYMLAYLLILQLGLGLVVPDRWLYDHRVPYELFKEDPRMIDRVLDHMEQQIRQEGLTDYVIMLGDSVGYSGPGGPDQSIGFYMEQLSQQQGEPLTVFNLALPAMQTGDIYVILLKLQERGISTDRVVINLLYGGFVARNPDPPIVFWLADDLKQLDPESWRRFHDHLAQNNRVRTERSLSGLFDQYIAPHVTLLSYRPLLKSKLTTTIDPRNREVYDTRSWREKPELPRILSEYQYQRAFDLTPFDMTEKNPQVYFLQKIIDLTRGGEVLVYLTPTNQELMSANVTKPGYRENLSRIDAWFQGQPATYRNWEDRLEADLFADHVHLTPDGYRALAGLLLQEMN